MSNAIRYNSTSTTNSEQPERMLVFPMASVQLTQEMVKAIAGQGWAVRRAIKATLMVAGRSESVMVIGAWNDGALIARENGQLAHKPCSVSLLSVEGDTAAHLQTQVALQQAAKAGRLCNPGQTSSDHRLNWNVRRAA